MACVEDCDQILIASTIKDSQGWEENGNSISSSTELCWCSFVVYMNNFRIIPK